MTLCRCNVSSEHDARALSESDWKIAVGVIYCLEGVQLPISLYSVFRATINPRNLVQFSHYSINQYMNMAKTSWTYIPFDTITIALIELVCLEWSKFLRRSGLPRHRPLPTTRPSTNFQASGIKTNGYQNSKLIIYEIK